MTEKKLEVRMLGRFSITYAGKEIVIDRNTVSKTTQLLQIFLFRSRDGISKASLIDALYGRAEVENKNGSLNNTIFRLRKQLKAAGLPESNYINIRGGMCIWDKRIPVWTDVHQFEELVCEGMNSSGIKRLKAYRQAAACYMGEFLPNMIGEDWVTVENIHCRDLYVRCVQELCEYYMKQECYEEVLELSTAAADIYPYEDWQLWQIDSLMAMARYQEAMDVYEKAAKMVFDELGIAPSGEMLKRFHKMGEYVSHTACITEDIKKRLCENKKAEGAYYCTLPGFIDTCHILHRLNERSYTDRCLMLCTLKNGTGTISNEDVSGQEAIKQLAEAIRKSLRKGDVYTRCSRTQYLVMVSELSTENCRIVSERIRKNFEENKSRIYDIDFQVISIEEAENGAESS